MERDERVVELLEELVAWARLSSRAEVVSLLKETLADPKHFNAYAISDGSRSQKEVGEAVGLSQPAVSLLWQKWRRLGIARLRSGRTAHLIHPSEFGLELAALADGNEKSRRNRSGEKEASGDPIF